MTIREAKRVCTSLMLMCLDRDHRIAYILGEILDRTSEEAATALDISSDAFRKRLSRARSRMEELTAKQCGIVNTARPCRCGTQAVHARKQGLIAPDRLTWAKHRTVEQEAADLAELDRIEMADDGCVLTTRTIDLDRHGGRRYRR